DQALRRVGPPGCVVARPRPATAPGDTAGFSATGFLGDRVFLGYGDAALRQPRLRIDALGAVLPHLEVEVRAGGEPAAAHLGDLVARRDVLALGDLDRLHVAVDGDGAVVGADAHPLAETA